MMKKLAMLLALLCLALPLGALAADAPSDDIYAFEALIDGVLYKFPCPYSVLAENGWKFKDAEEAEETLTPNSYTSIQLVKGGLGEKMEMYAYFLHFDIQTQPLSACYVGGVKLEVPFGKDEVWAPVTIAKGIQLGEGTRDDIPAALGDPSDLYEGNSSVVFTYKTDSYQQTKISFFEEKLHSIEVQNFTEPADAVKSPVSQEVPQYIQDYVVPTELGEDLTSRIAQFDGDLYQMPAPVSAFVANGWKVMNTRYEYVEAQGFAIRGVTMMRNNKSSDFSLRNLSDLAVLPENCVVDSLNPSGDFRDYEIVLPGGITVGSKAEDVMAKYEPVLTDLNKTDEKYDRYIARERGQYDIEIYVSKETGLVTSIEYDAP